ncbi:MAG: glycosyltransferase family 4 protein [Polyangiaceae bacterium]
MRVTSRAGMTERAKSMLRHNSRIFGDDLRETLRAELDRGFDVLHLEHTWTGWLGENHREKALLHVPNLNELDFLKAPRRLLPLLNHTTMLQAEKKLIRTYKTIVTLTPRLASRVKELNPTASVATVPLGLDLSLYPFDGEALGSKTPVLGLIGSFGWGPSYSAAERLLLNLWPHIKRRVPSARLSIVGHNARDVRCFVSARTSDVTIHDGVPDILPYFRQIDVMLYAPRFGSGMKVKVLEAFALGTAVVTTKDGVEGLPAEDGKHAGICEDDQGLIDRAAHLLEDAAARIALRKAARRLVEEHCSPASTVAAIERVYSAIDSSNGGG